ncbi:MAG: pilus assembly protein PilM, partial [Gemmatimonadetes bacterium]|nr:pilus assembly protein PilM [Gemmatimonadota bacterium]
AVGVERAAAFLQSAARDAGTIQRVYSAGGGSRIPGLTQALANRLNLPVEAASPMQRLPVKDGVFENLNPEEVGPLLMLAVGLAMRA